MENKFYFINSKQNLVMDIEATIEDLEAQAYFASIDVNQRITVAKAKVQITLNTINIQVCILTMPIIGKDFVAGFCKDVIAGRQTWLLVPNTALQFFEVIEGEPRSLEVNAHDFLQEKLLGAQVRISTTISSPPIIGRVLSSAENRLRLGLVSPREIQIPTNSILILAVEKLSSNIQ